MTITLRSNLSRPLTPEEADGNITDLNTRLSTVETKISPIVPIYTGVWASKPAANTVPLGSVAIITDVPIGSYSTWIAGATLWKPQGGEIILGQSGIAGTPLTGTTSAVTTDLITIPGGILGPNGQLVVEGEFSMTNNANNKTLQLRFETGPIRVFSSIIANTSSVSFRAVMTNRGSQNSNRIAYNTSSGLGSAGTAENTSLDTSINQTLRVLMQLAVGTDTVTFERWTVAVRPF